MNARALFAQLVFGGFLLLGVVLSVTSLRAAPDDDGSYCNELGGHRPRRTPGHFQQSKP